MLTIRVSSDRPKDGKTCMVALLSRMLSMFGIRVTLVADGDGDLPGKLEVMRVQPFDIISILANKEVTIVDHSPLTEAIPQPDDLYTFVGPGLALGAVAVVKAPDLRFAERVVQQWAADNGLIPGNMQLNKVEPLSTIVYGWNGDY